VRPQRTSSRPERHFLDSFITIRLSIARAIAGWLPRCPLCHRPVRRLRRIAREAWLELIAPGDGGCWSLVEDYPQ
jgi:hypothetical protein